MISSDQVSWAQFPQRGLLPGSSPKILGFGRGHGVGGAYFQSRVFGVCRLAWRFPLKHFNTSVVTLRCDQARK